MYKRQLEASPNWDATELKTVLEQTAAALDVGFGKIGQPLRVALTGGSASPDIAATLEMVGRDRSVQRIHDAVAYIEEHN